MLTLQAISANFGSAKCHNIRTLVGSAGFRELDNAITYVAFFRDCEPQLSYNTVSLLIGISSATAFRWEKEARRLQNSDVLDEHSSAVLSGPNALLRLAEESDILRWIEERQELGNSPSPKEVRRRAAEIRKMGVVDKRQPGRAWWRSLKRWYGERIDAVTSDVNNKRKLLEAENARILNVARETEREIGKRL
jgi:hypothetical protein